MLFRSGWLGAPLGWLGAPLGWLGAPLGWLGVSLGWLKAPLGWLGAPSGWLEAPWGLLGAPLGCLGAPLGWLGAPLGWLGAPLTEHWKPRGTPKGPPKSITSGPEQKAANEQIAFLLFVHFWQLCMGSEGSPKNWRTLMLS